MSVYRTPPAIPQGRRWGATFFARLYVKRLQRRLCRTSPYYGQHFLIRATPVEWAQFMGRLFVWRKLCQSGPLWRMRLGHDPV